MTGTDQIAPDRQIPDRLQTSMERRLKSWEVPGGLDSD